MVWNTNEEAEIMGRKREPHIPGPAIHSSHTPHYTSLPTYARLQFPLTENDASTRRMADDLRRLASQIEFCINRNDLHITRRLHLIHLEFRAHNQRWLDERKDAQRYSTKPAKSGNTKYSNSE